jgi:NAD(P)-dependent dehydrogenase (short-subunit alcohol dehydrogenase family)
VSLTFHTGIIQTSMQTKVNLDSSVVDWILARTLLKRVGQPAEVADSYLFLLADTGSFMTGTILTCDGGLSV